ncbi:MAG: hypothetical protein SF097_02735 [Acidobacteriota bacterium]|nr:hypothetical protein [Acidobacteriota bacterium]
MSDSKKNAADICWNVLVELRKELVESQKIRAQVIGFKITLVSTGIGVIVANLDKVPIVILVVPAFAAIFLDYLIQSYTFSIRRIGVYCREYLEPKILEGSELPGNFPLWERFMTRPKARQHFSMTGHLGITSLAVTAALFSLFVNFRWSISLPLLLALIWLFYLDVKVHTGIDRKRLGNIEEVS